MGRGLAVQQSLCFFVFVVFLIVFVRHGCQSQCVQLNLASSTGSYTYSGDACVVISGSISKPTTFSSSGSLSVTIGGDINVANIDTSSGKKFVLVFQAFSGRVDVNGNNYKIVGNGYVDETHKPGLMQIYAPHGGSLKNLSIYKAPAWNVALLVNNFDVSTLHIDAQSNRGNTDGIDIVKSSHVNLKDIYVKNNDDCIAIGEGVSNLYVDGITCIASSNGGGIALATNDGLGDITDVTVVNAYLYSQVPGALSIRTTSSSTVKSNIANVKLTGTVYSGNHLLLITQQCPNQMICDPQVNYWSQLGSYCPPSSYPASVAQGSRITGIIDLSGVLNGYTSHPSYFSYVLQYANPSYCIPKIILPNWASYRKCGKPSECFLTTSAQLSEDTTQSNNTSTLSSGAIAGIILGCVVVVLVASIILTVRYIRKKHSSEIV